MCVYVFSEDEREMEMELSRRSNPLFGEDVDGILMRLEGYDEAKPPSPIPIPPVSVPSRFRLPALPSHADCPHLRHLRVCLSLL